MRGEGVTVQCSVAELPRFGPASVLRPAVGGESWASHSRYCAVSKLSSPQSVRWGFSFSEATKPKLIALELGSDLFWAWLLDFGLIGIAAASHARRAARSIAIS